MLDHPTDAVFQPVAGGIEETVVIRAGAGGMIVSSLGQQLEILLGVIQGEMHIRHHEEAIHL
jgi:hypothetical protein